MDPDCEPPVDARRVTRWHEARDLRFVRGRAPMPMCGGAGLGLAVALAALVLFSGCERESEGGQYQALHGQVVSLDAQAGEVEVLAAPRHGQVRPPKLVTCVVTRDSEIYVNDRFCAIDGLRSGDEIEMFGFRDPDPQFEQFIVAYASVYRDLVPPDRPKFVPPVDPASEPHERTEENG